MSDLSFERCDVYVTEPHRGERLDVFLAKSFPDISRSTIQQHIEQGLVAVNGSVSKKRFLVTPGDLVVFHLLPPSIPDISPEPMSFHVLYEDEDLFVIDKPAGLVVHPAPGNPRGTFVNGLLSYCKDIECLDPIRPGIVHRLDKDTSGVLIAVKTKKMLWDLSKQFQDRSVEKEYLAVVVGSFTERMEVRKAIGRDLVHRKKMMVRDDCKESSTDFIPLKIGKEVSFVRAIPHTGRTHQIRVHLQYLGFPVLGDAVYGRSEINEKHRALRQLLHCHRITFFHPRTQQRMTIEASIPKDILPYT
jgi:23S rRNA pseudouridine1911/1915/1917 synthase